MGFRALIGFRALGFRGLGFRGLGLWGLRALGFRGLGFRGLRMAFPARCGVYVVSVLRSGSRLALQGSLWFS